MLLWPLQMPEMNGYEATQKIREAGYSVPIVAVTASAIKGEREKALASGMSDFLTKPFKKKDLEPLLVKWLSSTEGENERSQIPDASNPIESEPTNSALPNFSASESSVGDSDPAPIPETDSVRPEDIFDFDAAVDTFLGDEEAVRSLLGTLADRVEASITVIREALDPPDFEKLRFEAHAIKGSSYNLSAMRLGNAAAELEISAKGADRAECDRWAGQVFDEFDRFFAYSANFTDS